ncbi:MAG: DUF1002 domain-containing protein [Eubacteriales bacterium]|nr:DUF1002 domain-containing protein [Eubacteriales bacterium]
MKKKLLSSMILAFTVALGCAAPAMADSRKVVTLGVDLTDEQKNTMMRYFGVDYNSVDVIYINNTDERNHLGAYVPLEQIGNYTFSCALVAPTSSGGIQVKTANLEWVTCNMIASTLSTSGVTNCQVVAACPFKVSGTGALTGVIMAYETASKQQLDPQKVELANQELVTTGNLANNVGQSKATAVINETKTQVIENNITNIEEITNIVNNVSNNYDVDITADQSAEIAELMQQIAQQEYDIVQLKATLDRVQANVAGDAGASEEEQKAAEEKAQASEEAAIEAIETADEGDYDGDGIVIIEGEETQPTENILENTDISVLEEGGSTVDEGDTTQTVQEQSEQQESEDFGIPEATGDGTMDTPEATEAGNEQLLPGDGTVDTEALPGTTDLTEAADTANTDTSAGTTDLPEATDTEDAAGLEEQGLTADSLGAEDKAVYDEVEEELKTAFQGNVVIGDDGTQVYLTADAATQVQEKTEQYILQVMTYGEDTIAALEATDPSINQNIVAETSAAAPDKNYEDAQLKQIDKYVRRLVFTDSENILADSMLEENDKAIVYQQVMDVLEKAYKVEDTEDTQEAGAFETFPEENADTGSESPAVDGMTTDGLTPDETTADGMMDDGTSEDFFGEDAGFAGFEEETGTF